MSDSMENNSKAIATGKSKFLEKSNINLISQINFKSTTKTTWVYYSANNYSSMTNKFPS